MDKHQAGERVTIKINGQDRIFHNGEMLNIKPEQETAAAAEKEEESFDWALPTDHEGASDFFVLPEPKKKKKPAVLAWGAKTKSPAGPAKKGPSWVKAPVLAAVCAVAIGSSLGYIVLKMGSDNPAGEISKPAGTVPAASPGEKAPAAAAVSGASLKTFLVQGGIYSSESAAEQMRSQVSEKAVPAEVFKLGEQYFLFLGAAGTLEESKALAVFLKEYGIDVFWKEIEIKPASAGKNDAVLAGMNDLYQQLAAATAGLLLTEENTLDRSAYDKKAAEVASAVKGASNPAISKANAELAAAAELMRQYETSKQTEQLLQAQHKLLSFLQSYQTLGQS